MQDLPATYVQTTRAVEGTMLYTPKSLFEKNMEDIELSPLAAR